MDNLQVLSSKNRYSIERGFYSSSSNNEIDDARANNLISDGDAVVVDVTADESIPQASLLPNGQPSSVTRGVKNSGYPFYQTVNDQSPNIDQGTDTVDYNLNTAYTGLDPTTGAVTGTPPITGAASCFEFDVLTDNLVRLNLNSSVLGSPGHNLNGKFGFYYYIEAPDDFTGQNLQIEIDGMYYGCNSNIVRLNEWAFLAVVRENDPVDNTDYEDHPFGVAELFFTSDTNRMDWVSGPTNSIKLGFDNMSGAKVRFCGFWTGFDTTPLFVIGADITGDETSEYLVPKFSSYGWQTYVAQPNRVLDGSWEPWESSWELSDSVKDALNSVHDAGGDVHPHTVNHLPMATLTDPGQIRYELIANQASLVGEGYWRGSDVYVSPQSSFNQLTNRIIENAGVKLQRHAPHDMNYVTPFGLLGTKTFGSIDVGGGGWIFGTGNNYGYQYNYPHIDNLRKYIAMSIKYGKVTCIFYHSVTELGDPGDGTGDSDDSVTMYRSTHEMMMDEIRRYEKRNMCKVVTFSQLLNGDY